MESEDSDYPGDAHDEQQRHRHLQPVSAEWEGGVGGAMWEGGGRGAMWEGGGRGAMWEGGGVGQCGRGEGRGGGAMWERGWGNVGGGR